MADAPWMDRLDRAGRSLFPWLWPRARRQIGRIRVRLLFINLLVVLVPVAGVEFADIYEQQLLGALERDMRDQAVLTRRFLEASLRDGDALDLPRHEDALRIAAARTRTRIRIFDRDRTLIIDSHQDGPPEGPEPTPPLANFWSRGYDVSADVEDHAPWPAPADRLEVREALAGQPSSYTRVRGRQPAVLLFISEPIIPRRRVMGVVYVVRSTAPVLMELYRVRQGLYLLTGAALLFTLLVTLLLAWSISRPLARLSRVAKRIAGGERDVEVPVGGHGEIRELGESLSSMTTELRKRLQFASDFAADVTHEFKSPLTSIRGAAELLNEGAADDPDARDRFLGNILLDVARLDRLVSRLLELGRIEAATDTARNLVIIKTLVSKISARFPDLRIAIECKDPVVRGRILDLERAIINLIENALRFSPPGEPVVLTVIGGEGIVVFHVDDAGPGVPESDRERVFTRFFTTEGSADGTGLGLPIVRAVAEAHGGHVHVEVSPRGGARFSFSLPTSTRNKPRQP